MEIYVYHENEQFGPYPPESILEYLRQDIFQESDLAWHVGQSDWKPLREILNLTPADQSTAPALAFGGPLFLLPDPPRNGSIFRSQILPSSGQVRPVYSKRSGAMIALNLTLVLVVLAAAYVRFGSGGAVASRYFSLGGKTLKTGFWTSKADGPAATPSPVAAVPIATPAKLKTAAAGPNPKPFNLVKLTYKPSAGDPPPATPKPFDLAEVAQNPAAWPKAVILKEATIFPAVYQSKVIGSLTVPPGTAVLLVGIRGDQLALVYNGGGKWVSWKLTDIEKRVKRVFSSPAPVHRSANALSSGCLNDCSRAG